MWRNIILLCLILGTLSCAHSKSENPKNPGNIADITEDNPGYYEPELHKKYYDERYEDDPAFEKYYEWKKKK